MSLNKNLLRIAVAGEREVVEGGDAERGERVRVFADLLVARPRDGRSVEVQRGVVGPDRDQRRRLRQRNRVENQPIEYGEERGVGGDADGDREDGHQREAGRFEQRAQRGFEVGHGVWVEQDRASRRREQAADTSAAVCTRCASAPRGAQTACDERLEFGASPSLPALAAPIPERARPKIGIAPRRAQRGPSAAVRRSGARRAKTAMGPSLSPDHSARSAVIGSTLVARRAGSQQARSATSANTELTLPKTSGSIALVR